MADVDFAHSFVAIAGLGVTNSAAARALVAHGHGIVLLDDGDPADGKALAADLGVDFVHRPAEAELIAAFERADAVLPAPGLPESHSVFTVAEDVGIPVVSEFDLAMAWDDRPILAITGTNGKTTVSSLVSLMLERSGIPNEAVGNLEVPLVQAISDPEPQCFVVEASSFRLGHSEAFRPLVATWLNFSPDHLDIHRSLAIYEAAKASIWANQDPGDTAVVNLEDPVVASHADEAGGQVITFGLGGDVGATGLPDYHQIGDSLNGPQGPLCAVGDLWSALPHDRLNCLAAAATATAGGASLDGIRSALREFSGLAHRVQLIADQGGIRWYDDSKATAPHATLAAASGFSSVVLIAGGYNKGLDLSALSEADSVVAVIGIGASAAEVVESFDEVPTVIAETMAAAVAAARDLASTGDVVLLSPGCASFDSYGSYSERGDHFTSEVQALLESGNV